MPGLFKKMVIATDATWDGKDLVVQKNRIAKCTNVIGKYRIYSDRHLGENKKRNTYVVDTETGEVRLNNLPHGHREVAKMLRIELKKEKNNK